jgi:hypothetical protein
MDGPESLDELTIDLYRCTLTRGRFDSVELADLLGVTEKVITRARDTLVNLRLLVVCSDGSLVASDPEISEFELSAPIEREILARQRTLVQLHHQLRSLTPIYSDANSQRRSATPTRIVSEPADVRREIASTAQRCKQEVLAMQPGGGRRAETLDEAFERDLSVLKRGVSMRTLYQRTARASPATQNYVRRVIEAGAQIRVTTGPFERLLIFDREVAFVPQERHGEQAPGAAVVTDPTVVGFLCRVFENYWQWSEPYSYDFHDGSPTLDAPRTAIVRLMAAGLKDDVIARQLGMATRTCRRYMAEILNDLGASSRFEAGVKAVQLGLVRTGTDGDGDTDADAD